MSIEVKTTVREVLLTDDFTSGVKDNITEKAFKSFMAFSGRGVYPAYENKKEGIELKISPAIPVHYFASSLYQVPDVYLIGKMPILLSKTNTRAV